LRNLTLIPVPRSGDIPKILSTLTAGWPARDISQ
jgi:hypothetical protein